MIGRRRESGDTNLGPLGLDAKDVTSHGTLMPTLVTALLFCIGIFLWNMTTHSQVYAQTVSYSYDTCPNGVGRLCSITDTVAGPSLSRTFEYDQRGNVTTTVYGVGVNTYMIVRSYDSMNRLVDLTYPTSATEPSGEKIQYTYNNQGLLEKISSVTYGVDYLKNLDYNAIGQKINKMLGNDLTTVYGYADDQTGCPRAGNFRLCTITTPDTNPTTQNLTYSYDDAGNVTDITDGVGIGIATQHFDYDALDRLIAASGTTTPASSYTYSYTYNYNAVGSMTCNSQISPCPGQNYLYQSYGAWQPYAVTYVGPPDGNCMSSTTATCFGYDVNGNRTGRWNGGVWTSYSWDLENRLTSVSVAGSPVASFRYDDAGQRVLKTEGSTSTTSIEDGLYECSTACIKSIFAGGQRIAQRVVGSSNVTYFLTDQLGSTTKTVGEFAGDYAYYPYGGTRPAGQALGISYGFTGQELDNTQLYYYGARYYDPSLGRFLSPDSVDPAPNNPQSLNLYSYVLNNPQRYVDPTGNREIEWESTQLQMDSSLWATCYICSNTSLSGGSGGASNSGIGLWDVVHTSLDVIGLSPDPIVGPAADALNAITYLFNGQFLDAGISGVATIPVIGSVATGGKLGSGAARAASKDLLPYYPPNRGFSGSTYRLTLGEGTIVDRYGGTGGFFLSPKGTPPWARSLPFGVETRPLRTFEVLKQFEVEAGRAAPWFGKLGGGTVYDTGRLTVQELIDSGYLRSIP